MGAKVSAEMKHAWHLVNNEGKNPYEAARLAGVHPASLYRSLRIKKQQFKCSLRKSDQRFRIGRVVYWNDPESEQPRVVTVVRHGRDHEGIYTEVRVQGQDETIRVHRSSLHVS